MADLPPPPSAYATFTARYPDLEKAWENMAMAGRDGPLDKDTQRLVKLAIAVGAFREGAVHASVRKAIAMGIEVEALEQVVALAASTIGMPATVAAFQWVRDIADDEG
jgi:alkylhydroperoxidase/carboxymuconolactone decarboxylase family protein YurZ